MVGEDEGEDNGGNKGEDEGADDGKGEGYHGCHQASALAERSLRELSGLSDRGDGLHLLLDGLGIRRRRAICVGEKAHQTVANAHPFDTSLLHSAGLEPPKPSKLGLTCRGLT